MENIVERIKVITRDEVIDINYLYDNLLVGMIGTIFNKAGVPKINPIPEEYFYAFKEVFEEEFFGGIEPEWASLESCKNWDILHTRFVYRTEDEHHTLQQWDGQTCPYIDKSIPYLCSI